MYDYYTKDIKSVHDLDNDGIFVFGSNLAGRHGRGAAKTAMHYFSAEYGIGHRFTGKCYAIPTKNHKIKTLPLEDIVVYVDSFISIAALFPERVFIITKIGCGLAGYKDHEIAPLFKGAPSNCKFHIDWKPHLENPILE